MTTLFLVRADSTGYALKDTKVYLWIPYHTLRYNSTKMVHILFMQEISAVIVTVTIVAVSTETLHVTNFIFLNKQFKRLRLALISYVVYFLLTFL